MGRPVPDRTGKRGVVHHSALNLPDGGKRLATDTGIRALRHDVGKPKPYEWHCIGMECSSNYFALLVFLSSAAVLQNLGDDSVIAAVVVAGNWTLPRDSAELVTTVGIVHGRAECL